jgi:predicted DCC family thiol-disulfide oxidoreductase YuxK
MGTVDPVKPLVLFDGVCNLCNGAVLFLIRQDRLAKLTFASLQSAYGRHQLVQFNWPTDRLNTMLLIKEGKIFHKSNAILEIAFSLPGLWPIFYVFKIVPAFIRDFIYDFVAKNRYSWFGKKDECMIPTPTLLERFMG